MPRDHDPAPREPAPSSRPARDALPPGTLLGDSYRVERTLGQGGFGVVYLATDLALQRAVAIKEYLPVHLAGRGEGTSLGLREAAHQDAFVRGLQSFLNEARLLAQFDHPSLVRVYRFWEENHTAYMAMPFCDGPTLTAARRSMLRPPDEGWLREQLLLPLLGALEMLHGASCLHRDVSPDNILLLPDGRPVLLDFGSARRVTADMTQPLTAVLNPSYAAIEQFAESTTLPQGPWTDLYGLGCVAYYALSGRAPAPATARAVSEGASMPAAEVGRLLEHSFPGLHYSPALLAAIDTALALRPTDRPQTAAELRALLLTTHVQPDLAIEPPPREAPRDELRLSAVPMDVDKPEDELSEEEERAIRNVIDIALGDFARVAPAAGRPTRIEPQLEPVAAPPSPFAPSPIVPPPRKAALKVVASGPAAEAPATDMPAVDAPAAPMPRRDEPRLEPNPLWPLETAPAAATDPLPDAAAATALREPSSEAEPAPFVATDAVVASAPAPVPAQSQPPAVSADTPVERPRPAEEAARTNLAGTEPFLAPEQPQPSQRSSERDTSATEPAVRLVPPPVVPPAAPAAEPEEWAASHFAADDTPPPRSRKTALGAVAVAAAALAAVAMLRMTPALNSTPDTVHIAQAPVSPPPARMETPPTRAPVAPATTPSVAATPAASMPMAAVVAPAAPSPKPSVTTGTTPSHGAASAALTPTPPTVAAASPVDAPPSPAATPTTEPATVPPAATTNSGPVIAGTAAPSGSPAATPPAAHPPTPAATPNGSVVAAHGLHPFKPRANTSGTSSTRAPSASPRAACGSRQNFALYYCMKAQCRQPRYAGSAECRKLREDDEL